MPRLGPGGLSAARTGMGPGGQAARQHLGVACDKHIERQDVRTMSLDARQFREVVGLFATGVTIIVAEVAGQVHAMTANSVTSVSLDPLLMLFCPSRKA